MAQAWQRRCPLTVTKKKKKKKVYVLPKVTQLQPDTQLL